MKLKNIVNNFIQSIFKPIIWKIAEIDKLQEQLDSANYVLNHMLSIENFPVASGNLRKVQLFDVELLRIFHEICVKNNLTYWLDFGTLLGAVRHKGFIPWDDDLDVSMPREDFEKLRLIIDNHISDLGFSVTKKFDRFSILMWDAGGNLDIYPVDIADKTVVGSSENLINKIKSIDNFIKNNKKKHNYNSDLLYQKKLSLSIISANEISKENSFYYYAPECANTRVIFSYDTIYPLKQMTFEGYSFFVPNDFDLYLIKIYGSYMDFPKNGMLHHKGGNGDHIYDNFVKKKYDIDNETEKYKQIHF